jgi:hypothetical protein
MHLGFAAQLHSGKFPEMIDPITVNRKAAHGQICSRLRGPVMG